MNGTPERRSTSVSRASDSAKRLVPATTDALSRRVPPVRHEVDATVRTRVATILSAVEHGTRSRARAVESEPAQPTCLIELLTKTVQRVEHLMTERTRRTSDRSAPQMQESRGYRTYRPGEDARSALSWPSIEHPNAPMEETTPQVGLRGLAARFGAASPNSPARRVRAPLLVPPNATVTEWPDDQLAALLDDAARRGGVDTAEEAP